ncbi:Hypothetical protein PBC10988_9640 [Planctomycetales bacterium 10988]|nr:Hypothetical protein PBC10988_9640 [Planctomycetales bacterium 10988]
MKRFERQGFTLVELLVVMSIIAILAAMLMPAVNAVRETARRTQCTNQIRNVGIALMQHDAAKGELPGWAVSQNPDYSEVNGGNAVGWVFPTLPFMERNDIYNRYNANAGGNRGKHPNQTIKVLLCPNDPSQTGIQMTYAVNCGMRNTAEDNGERYGANRNAVPEETHSDSYMKERPQSSLFHNRYLVPNNTSANGNFWQGRNSMSLSMVSADDGTATTIMAGENLDANNWSRPGGDADAQVQVYESDVCICFFADSTNGPPEDFNLNTFTMRINGLQGGNSVAPRPKSRHPGGVNVVFCDQHTKFLPDEIDWFTYSALYTPAGNRINRNNAGPRDWDGTNQPTAGRVIGAKYVNTLVDEDRIR